MKSSPSRPHARPAPAVPVVRVPKKAAITLFITLNTRRNKTVSYTHLNKKSAEQFEIRTHKRLLDIVDPTARTIDELKKLNLPAGVDITCLLYTSFPEFALLDEFLQ